MVLNSNLHVLTPETLLFTHFARVQGLHDRLKRGKNTHYIDSHTEGDHARSACFDKNITSKNIKADIASK